MPRDASDGLDGEHTFRRHASPLGDRTPAYAQSARNPCQQPRLGAEQLHTLSGGVRVHD